MKLNQSQHGLKQSGHNQIMAKFMFHWQAVLTYYQYFQHILCKNKLIWILKLFQFAQTIFFLNVQIWQFILFVILLEAAWTIFFPIQTAVLNEYFNPIYIRHKDFRPPSVRPSVTLVLPPLGSETGWTGELWSNCILLILKN